MNILVCMKAVPSTGQVQVDGQYKLQRDSAKLEWNIADQSALESALLLKRDGDTVTVLTMGPAKIEDSLRDLIARGADSAVLLTDPAFAGADTFATANTLAAAAQALGAFDLILCGRRAIDGETGQVPGLLACALNIPCITNVERLDMVDSGILANRRLDNGIQQLSAPLPCLISICEYTYSLRLPSIMGMRKAKSKTVEILNRSHLNIPKELCGLQGSLTKVISMDHKFPGLRKGPKVTDPSTAVSTIISMVKEVSP